MARKRTHPDETAADSTAAPPGEMALASPDGGPHETSAAFSTPPANEPADSTTNSEDRLSAARKKLARMEEINKFCFRHRNDLAKIEHELMRLGCTDTEVEYLMEPKGARMIPGFGYADLERQRQYANFLSARRSNAPTSGYAARETESRAPANETELT